MDARSNNHTTSLTTSNASPSSAFIPNLSYLHRYWPTATATSRNSSPPFGNTSNTAHHCILTRFWEITILTCIISTLQPTTLGLNIFSIRVLSGMFLDEAPCLGFNGTANLALHEPHCHTCISYSISSPTQPQRLATISLVSRTSSGGRCWFPEQ